MTTPPLGISATGARSYRVFRAMSHTGALDIIDIISAGAATAPEICDPLGILPRHRSHMLLRLTDAKILFRRESLKKPYSPYVYRKNNLLDYLRQKTEALARSLQVYELDIYKALGSSEKTTTAIIHIYSGLTRSPNLGKVMGLGIDTIYIRKVLGQCTRMGIVSVQQAAPDIYGVLSSGVRHTPSTATEYVLLHPEVVEIISIARDIAVT